MKEKLIAFAGTAVLSASAGTAFAGNIGAIEEDAPIAMVQNDQPSPIGYVELNFGMRSFDTDRDGDYDEVRSPSLSGQTFARVGDLVLEFQASLSGDTDGGSDSDINASLGAFGHYLFETDLGMFGTFAGVTGGAENATSDGNYWGVLGVEYANGGFVASLGTARHSSTETGSQVAESFNYASASYEHKVSDALGVSAEGYFGDLNAFDTDEDGTFGQLSVAISYDLNDHIGFKAGVTKFVLDEDDDPDSGAAGTELSLGVSVALGGSNSAARSAIPFDTPDLHRPLTWSSEAFD